MGTNDFSAFMAGRMKVVVSEDRRELGIKSAKDAAELMKKLMAEQDEIRIVFAAAPSQNEFLEELSKDKSIDWPRVTAFHMDEYIGLPAHSGELFAEYLTKHIFSKVNFGKIYFIDSQT
jgi:glucosamine-6-phosphate deaminase